MPGPDFSAFADRLAVVPAPDPATIEVGTVPGSGGRFGAGEVALAYQLHRPTGEGWRTLLVFYPGPGAGMDAGYDRFAAALVAAGEAAGTPVAVCLTDVRGHGRSGGRRGHAPSPTAVWDDVGRLLAHFARRFPAARLVLGGHSGAAGLLLNALTRRRPPVPVAGLVLLAPHLGYHAALERADAPFAGAAFWPFVVNWFSGGRLAGGLPAVRFAFPASLLAGGVFVERYTVNMALAFTPDDPAGQMAQLTLPVWVGMPDADEVVDPAKLEAFLARHAPAVDLERLPGSTHLDCVLDTAPALLDGIGRLLPPFPVRSAIPPPDLRRMGNMPLRDGNLPKKPALRA